MAKVIAKYFETIAQACRYTGAKGELTFIKEDCSLRIHDGCTCGGKVVNATTDLTEILARIAALEARVDNDVFVTDYAIDGNTLTITQNDGTTFDVTIALPEPAEAETDGLHLSANGVVFSGNTLTIPTVNDLDESAGDPVVIDLSALISAPFSIVGNAVSYDAATNEYTITDTDTDTDTDQWNVLTQDADGNTTVQLVNADGPVGDPVVINGAPAPTEIRGCDGLVVDLAENRFESVEKMLADGKGYYYPFVPDTMPDGTLNECFPQERSGCLDLAGVTFNADGRKYVSNPNEATWMPLGPTSGMIMDVFITETAATWSALDSGAAENEAQDIFQSQTFTVNNPLCEAVDVIVTPNYHAEVAFEDDMRILMQAFISFDGAEVEFGHANVGDNGNFHKSDHWNAWPFIRTIPAKGSLDIAIRAQAKWFGTAALTPQNSIKTEVRAFLAKIAVVGGVRVNN